MVGNSDDEIVKVATTLDHAGVKILELNLADDYVQSAIAPFSSIERLSAIIGRVRGEVGAVHRGQGAAETRARAARGGGSLQIESRGGRGVRQRSSERPRDRSENRNCERSGADAVAGACASIRRAQDRIDVVAVGGVNSGRDAYIAHLTGAKAVQVGSALIKEGAGALGRIDRELDGLLAENGKSSVNQIIGQIRFGG